MIGNKTISTVTDKSENRMLYWMSMSCVIIIGFFCRDYIALIWCLLGFVILFTAISYISKTIILTGDSIIIQSIFGKDITKDKNQSMRLTNSWLLINRMKLEFTDGSRYLFKGNSTDEVVKELAIIIAQRK
ncbi:hypothetical protein SAMN05192574_10744 [Mucilaginibacter gossypiicola]|uniref:Uncharacterized protein n=1 Tax=Mucilaginibacter gossypiicola TaxID=551995 RepID=A0A1H8NQ09_9SPHI|nr:hypothetical protein [Mucilaginibacter gossypiicola]SEO31629.1 hypothetical protein SAMN05192574_10744 [Mucilaginibacter gossypiicola]